MLWADCYLTQLTPATQALSITVVICSVQSVRLHMIWFGWQRGILYMLLVVNIL